MLVLVLDLTCRARAMPLPLVPYERRVKSLSQCIRRDVAPRINSVSDWAVRAAFQSTGARTLTFTDGAREGTGTGLTS